jgi:predicted HTH domain antitoxin
MQAEESSPRVPEGFEHALHLTRAELEDHVFLMAALKMFELGKVSLGKAAELARMPRVEFIETCARYRVSAYNYPDEELETELRSDLKTAEEALPR